MTESRQPTAMRLAMTATRMQYLWGSMTDRVENLAPDEAFAAWYPLGESNPCFRRERAAS